ncbi:MAG: 2-hydroxyglutaryl-CoA dehydratase [Sandaracinaceae bacterium]|nr:2-hydroxyglutaryl-CoA dehydratase [Sandaracinaceae bacterium]
MANAIRLPVLGHDASPSSLDDIERELAALDRAEAELLSTDPRGKSHWIDRMTTPVVKKRERDAIEIMNTGLTPAQDYLVEGALAGLGYRMRWIGTANQSALQTGKEFGNRGQCNPTHFTVGNLVQELIRLRDVEGIPSDKIVSDYVFLTAGACGPCRFGMYVTEYRKALRDAGFDGFRVMLFQQQGGLSQVSGDDIGLVFDQDFFLAVARSLIAGDVLNAIGWRLRPYEVEKGATDRAMDEAKRVIYAALQHPAGKPWARYLSALRQAKAIFEKVEIDPLRCRAKVSVIGEFWALHTEGDGNYSLKSFLESEGGECIVQPVAATILYNIWEVARDTEERLAVRGADRALWGLGELDELGAGKRLLNMKLANALLRGIFQGLAKTTGLYGYELPDMWRIAELAKDLYAHDLRGGEGHLEVGKLVMNAVDKKAHMVVSVKPFGCMPSSGVSDGVQSAVQAKLANIPFVAVETSGDGAANFYSRVLMTLFSAKRAAEEELARTYETLGITEAEARAFLKEHPRYASPLRLPRKTEGVTGRAALLLHEIAPLVRASRAERLRIRASRRLVALGKEAGHVSKKLGAIARTLGDPSMRERLRVDARLFGEIVKERWSGRGAATSETAPATPPRAPSSIDAVAAEE